MTIFLPLIALILPFFLWPIELFVPYPHIVEELAKAVVILLILKDIESSRRGIGLALGFGALFAVSETVLYIFNIAAVGSPETLLLRLVLTVPLHAGTSMIIFAFRLWGIPVAIVLHYLFNLVVPSLF